MICRHCGTTIRQVIGFNWRPPIYFDVETGGDVCCADKFTEKNENGQHEPFSKI